MRTFLTALLVVIAAFGMTACSTQPLGSETARICALAEPESGKYQLWVTRSLDGEREFRRYHDEAPPNVKLGDVYTYDVAAKLIFMNPGDDPIFMTNIRPALDAETKYIPSTC